MPAVAVAVITADGASVQSIRGMANVESGECVTPDHWWDLASLTKVLVTAPEVLAMVDSGALALADRLAAVWPRASGTPLAPVTVAQLLSHDAGLPGLWPLYRRGFGNGADLVDTILREGGERPPGSGPIYSDAGFILLGELVSHLSGQPLDELARRRGRVSYAPTPGPCVATERCPWRNRLLVGEVHDENAFVLGGVAGHAGAFGRLDDVAAYAAQWLVGSPSTPTISPTTAQAATQCWAENQGGERFGLGWWLSPTRALGGPRPGPRSYGASGFVGNRLWIEPARGYAVVILSNRIHPVRGDRAPFDIWCGRLLARIGELWDQNRVDAR